MSRPYLISWIVVVLLLFAGLVQGRANTVESCERGNPVRVVQFENTLATANDPLTSPETRAELRANLATLRAVEYVDPKTGAVDCDAAVGWFPTP